MKKLLALFVTLAIISACFVPFAFAADEVELRAVRFGELALEPAFSPEVTEYNIQMKDGEIPEPVFAANNGCSASVTAAAEKEGETTEITVKSDNGEISKVYKFNFYVSEPKPVSESSTAAICMTNGNISFANDTVDGNVNFLYLYGYNRPEGMQYSNNSKWGFFKVDLSKIPNGAEDITMTIVSDSGLSNNARNHLNNYTWTFGVYAIGGVKDSWILGEKPSVMSSTGNKNDITRTRIGEITNSDLTRQGNSIFLTFDVGDYITSQKEAEKDYATIGIVLEKTNFGTTQTTNVVRHYNYTNENFRPKLSWKMNYEYADNTLKNVKFENAAISEAITADKTEYNIVKLDNEPVKARFITSSVYSTAVITENNENLVEVVVTAKNEEEKTYRFNIVSAEEAGFSANGKITVKSPSDFVVNTKISGGKLVYGESVYTGAELINNSPEIKDAYIVSILLKDNTVAGRYAKKFQINPGSEKIEDISILPSDAGTMTLVSYIASEDEFTPISYIVKKGPSVSEYNKSENEIFAYLKDNENDIITITGKINEFESPVGIYVLKSGKSFDDYNGENLNEIFAYIGAEMTDASGYYGADISMKAQEEGEYKLYVISRSKLRESGYSYVKSSGRAALLQKIISAANNSSSALKAEMNLSSPESQAVKTLLLDNSFMSYINEDNLIEILKNFIVSSKITSNDYNKFIEIYNDAVILEKINEGKISDIGEYSEKAGIDEKAASYYDLLDGNTKETVSSTDLSGNNFLSFDEIAPVFKEKLIIRFTSVKSGIEVGNLISDFADYIEVEESADFYNNMTEANKLNVISLFKNSTPFADISQIRKAFREAVSEVKSHSDAYITSINFNDLSFNPVFSSDIYNYKVAMKNSKIPEPVFSVSSGATYKITSKASKPGEKTVISVTSEDGTQSNEYSFAFTVNREFGATTKSSSAIEATNTSVVFENDTAGNTSAYLNDIYLYISGYPASSSHYSNNQWGVFRINLSEIPDDFYEMVLTLTADNGISDTAKNHLNNYNWKFGVYSIEGLNNNWLSGDKPSVMSEDGDAFSIIKNKISEMNKADNMEKNGSFIYLNADIASYIKEMKAKNADYATIGIVLEDTDFDGSSITTNVFRPATFASEEYRPYLRWTIYPKDTDSTLADASFVNGALTEEIKIGKTEYNLAKTGDEAIEGEYITTSAFAAVSEITKTDELIEIEVTAESGAATKYTFNIISAEEAGFTEDGEAEISEENGKELFSVSADMNGDVIKPSSGMSTYVKLYNNSSKQKDIYVVTNIIRNGATVKRISEKRVVKPGSNELRTAFTLPGNTDGLYTLSYIAEGNDLAPISDIIIKGAKEEDLEDAENPVNVYYIDPQNDIIGINGIWKNAGSSLGIYVLNSGYSLDDYNGENFGDVFVYSGNAVADKNTGYYSAVVSFAGMSSGEYLIAVCDKSSEETLTFEYLKEDARENLLQEIIDAASDSDEALKSKLALTQIPKSDPVEKFLLNTSQLTYMNENNLIGILRGLIIDNNITKEDFAKFSELYKDAVILEKINEGRETDVSKYKDKASLDSSVIGYYNLLSDAEKARISSVLLAGNNFKNYPQLNEKFKEEVILYIASNYGNNDVVGKVITEFASDIGISGYMDKYNSLNSVKRNAVISAIKKKAPFKSYDELKNAFVSALNSAASQNNTPSGGGGGSSTSGAGPSLDFNIKGDVSNNSALDSDKIIDNSNLRIFNFKDLGGFEWANEAIKNLFDKNVVDGVTKDLFKPEREVKREEFIKMADSIYKGEASAFSFSDVSEGAWYYAYISKALSAGIIKGIGDNIFGIGYGVKREDMAVILTRMLAPETIEQDESKFDDDENISDYAKESVYYLKKLGIVSGSGDGSFNPKKIMRRAEAAVVINNVINYLENK